MYKLEEIKSIWRDVRASIPEDFDMAPSSAELWFGDLDVESFENNKITLCGSSDYKVSKVNEKYMRTLSEAFTNFLGFTPDIEVYSKKKEEDAPASNIFSSSLPTVNFEYTFDNFIVGSSNTFARAACWAVAQNVVNAEEGNTASQYNPLFLYGPSGIGKTHLMYAITNKIRKDKPNANIIYIKGEDFTNQLIDSLSRQAMSEFREKYRMCDILMIDDIQFIASKVATQEEFFHTFNALYENEKQIIMTSDRPPREIPDLESRLVGRFEMGLLADIQPPDLELRMAIIKKKAEQGKISIPDDVLTFLAENLRSNIRQIEGAIKKLSALSFLSGKEINMELAQNLLHELLGGAEPISVTVDKIFLSVFKKYGFKKDELISARRTKDLTTARHITIYLIYKITEMAKSNIGKIFNRDHATVIASLNIVEKKIESDNLFAMEITNLIKEVEGKEN
ncbi:MAG: chromosomal replication initiator protein DnaA [Ruminococcaceae bacterium]|nr:chromosomal replication initiator protein DnaA [Oscillospiraceae bacterium]